MGYPDPVSKERVDIIYLELNNGSSIKINRIEKSENTY